MNDLDRATYCEPDFSLASEIMDEEKDKMKENDKSFKKPRDLTDEEIESLGECF